MSWFIYQRDRRSAPAHLQLAPGGLLVLGDEVECAHLGQEVAAEGAPAGQLRVREQKEPKFKMCGCNKTRTCVSLLLYIGQDQRGKKELSDLSGVSG